MLRCIFFALCLFVCKLGANQNGEAYEFEGFHLVSSYLDCDSTRLTNIDGLKDAMTRAVKSSGATILNQVDHVFPPHGLTMVFLLSESHASIHTYPEHGACFVDFFTCGRSCSSDNFDSVLRDYLLPKDVNSHLLYREKHTFGVNADDKNLVLDYYAEKNEAENVGN